jgi:hypothetical protein
MPFFGQILGIEGTAWNLSAALFDRDLISLAYILVKQRSTMLP